MRIQNFLALFDLEPQSAGSGVAWAVGAVAVTSGNFWLMLQRAEEVGNTAGSGAPPGSGRAPPVFFSHQTRKHGPGRGSRKRQTRKDGPGRGSQKRQARKDGPGRVSRNRRQNRVGSGWGRADPVFLPIFSAINCSDIGSSKYTAIRDPACCREAHEAPYLHREHHDKLRGRWAGGSCNRDM